MAISWMKKGAESAQLAQQQQLAAEAAKAEQGKLFRFWLKDKEDAALTFVDGDLSPEGFLLPPRYYEHTIKVAGEVKNFVCPEQTDPTGGHKCPLCEQGDKPALVALFTVIDHRSFTSTKDNKVYSNTRKLLVVKPQSFEMLNKLAIKRGGLAGARFDVSRNGDKSPAIGNLYDFTEKKDIAELKAKYTRTYEKDGKQVTVCDFEPANYEEEIVFRDEAELRKLGFGKGAVSGNVSGFTGASPAGSAQQVDYSSQL